MFYYYGRDRPPPWFLASRSAALNRLYTSNRQRQEEWDDFREHADRRYLTLQAFLDEQDGEEQPRLLPYTPVLRALLCGVHDPQSPLSMLRGLENTLLRAIYQMLVHAWLQSVRPTAPAGVYGSHLRIQGSLLQEIDNEERIPGYRRHRPRPQMAFSSCGRVQFPPPTNINVNMMPFRMGYENTLPEYLQPYYKPIISKCPVGQDEYGKIYYLTIQESYVPAGTTQRRGGLHVESPGTQQRSGRLTPGTMIDWGGCGSYDTNFGGIYMASTVPHSTQIFNALVDHNYGEVNPHGGIEQLRPFLREGRLLEANELVCFTDRTPHEAMPQTLPGHRQFFRLVSSELSVWYAAHSTPNPNIPVPETVRIIQESKFG